MYILSVPFPALLRLCKNLTFLHANTFPGGIPLLLSERPVCHREYGYRQVDGVLFVLLERVLLPFGVHFNYPTGPPCNSGR